VVVLSLQGLDGPHCFTGIETELRKVKGVVGVTFDSRVVEARVETRRNVPSGQLEAAVADAGYLAIPGPGQGKWVAPRGFPEGSDVAIVIEKGDDVPDVDALAVPGKVTVVDFFADWCGPCRHMDAHLVKVLSQRSDVAVRKVNIVDWNTPAARRLLKMSSGIPYLLVYAKDGAKVAAVAGVLPEQLDAAIAKGAADRQASTN